MIPVERPRDPLMEFLYLLLRDHLTAGKVEAIMMNVESRPENSIGVFSNPYTIQHVEDLIIRLDRNRPSVFGITPPTGCTHGSDSDDCPDCRH